MEPGQNFWYLRLGGVRGHEGAEGRPVERGGVEGRHPHSQVSGGDADGRTLELQLLDQLVHSLQSAEGETHFIQQEYAESARRRLQLNVTRKHGFHCYETKRFLKT